MPNELTEMDYDEVSLVFGGANQDADVVLWKSRNTPDAAHPSTIPGQRHEEADVNKGATAVVVDLSKLDDDTLQLIADAILEDSDFEIVDDEVGKDDGEEETEAEEEEEESTGITEVTPPPAPGEPDYEAPEPEEPASKSRRLVRKAGRRKPPPPMDDEEEYMDEDEEEEEISMSKSQRDIVKAALAKAAAAEKRADEATAIAKAERDRRETDEEIAKAREDYGNLAVDHRELGTLLWKAGQVQLDPDDIQRLREMLTAADEQASTANIFNAVSTPVTNTVTGPAGEVEKLTKARQASNPDESYEQAYDRVLSDNPVLADRLIRETEVIR